MPQTDITAIITAHKEGRLSVPTLKSFWENIDAAQAKGLHVESIFVLDRPNDLTKNLFEQSARQETVVLETDFGDQGKARNLAVSKAKGKYISFLDADDLWSLDWLTRAHEFSESLQDELAIVHPEFNYFFEGQATIYRHIDQLSPEFDLDLLRISNYWDALCFCRRSVLKKHTFCDRDIEAGWAYEDWHWNIITLTEGCTHRVLPDSVLFKRRRQSSQTMVASKSKAKVRNSDLFNYGSDLYSKSI